MTASDGAQSLKLGVAADTGDPPESTPDYVQFQFCLNGPADDYLKVRFSVRFAAFASWDALGISSPAGWDYWWWVRQDGTMFDQTTFQTLDEDTWHDVEIVVDQALDAGTITVDGAPHAATLSAAWPNTPAGAELQCILILCHGSDAPHGVYVDDVYIRARP